MYSVKYYISFILSHCTVTAKWQNRRCLKALVPLFCALFHHYSQPLHTIKPLVLQAQIILLYFSTKNKYNEHKYISNLTPQSHKLLRSIWRIV